MPAKHSEIIFLVEQDPEGGYTAHSLGESIFTQADDIITLRDKIREAVLCHFPSPENRPRIVRLHEIHEEVFKV